ncbi:MAG: amidophosphoribosyltransferase [Lachnospiraceae bacterium]|nr:amidophosphoribosyltransferase [Lachnospiraceae bacterium]
MIDKPREKCGVFGIYTKDKEAAKDIFFGLTALQHRGQESAGMALCDTDGEKGNISFYKGMGLVSEVFKADRLKELKGNIGVGHVRYSTTGASKLENAQPVVFNYQKGTLATVHNGNIANAPALKEELLNDGTVFRSDTDTEVLALMVAKERAHSANVQEAVRKVSAKLKGSFAIIIMSPRKLVAMRDPLGIKPLCIGKRGEDVVIASESCALSAVDAEFVRDVLPGEIITVSKDGIASDTTLCGGKHAHCVFEYIYFARLDSVIDSKSVYDARFRAGEALAADHPVEADIVTGVPESGLAAAEGYSAGSGIPFGLVFHKNSYLGRTFIKPDKDSRKEAVHLKLNVIESAVKGKSIVIIDDSIVRGTTMANLIRLLKEKGAKEVHVRISSPPFLYPCYYGTDVPDNSQLIAGESGVEEIRKRIGADSLFYAKIEDFEKMVGDLPICKACFDGNYPTENF